MVFGSVALAVALAAAPRLAYQGEKPSRWEELEEGERTATTIISGAMLLILAGLVWRQLGKRKAPPQDPAKLHRWFHGYHYDWATGTVTNVTDMTRETDRIVVRTSRGIEYQPLPANEAGVSRTMVSEEATILFDGGKHDISVSFSGDVYDGLAFPVFHECEGHRITAIWRRRLRGEERGEYVVFRDWTTARNLDHPAASPHIHQSDAPIFSFVPIIVLGWIVGNSTNWLPLPHGVSRNLLFAAGFALVWFGVQLVIGTIDRGRSDEQLAQALLVIGANDAAPQDPKAAP